MKVGIGFSNQPDPLASGIEVANQALGESKIEKPSLVLAFCHETIEHELFLKGLKTILGEQCVVVGGSAVGIITNKTILTTGSPCGAVVFENGEIDFEVAAAGDVDKDEYLAGKKVGQKLAEHENAKLLLMFFDSVKNAPTPTSAPMTNASPPIIKGISDALRQSVPIFGGGVIGGPTFKHTRQFCGSVVDTQSVAGVSIAGNISPFYKIMHGCSLLDGLYHTITKIEGPVVYEINHRPAVEMIDEICGNADWRADLPVRWITIGVNNGSKYGVFDEKAYVNRLIVSTTPDEKGIVLFEPDLENGTEIQLMLRDSVRMVDSAKINCEILFEEINISGKKPVFACYIDCVGRMPEESHTLEDEAAMVQEICNDKDVPLLGFYSGVEIAPVMGESRGLDWTGVLLVFAVD